MISRLNPKIVYEETGEVFKEDEGETLTTYEGTIKNVTIEYTLGNPKCNYIKHGIIFIPIYATKVIGDDGESFYDYIGVFELNAGDFSSKNIYDDYGIINIDALDRPLLFDFVNVLYLQQYQVDTSDDEGEKEVKEVEEDEGEKEDEIDILDSSDDEDNDEGDEDDKEKEGGEEEGEKEDDSGDKDEYTQYLSLMEYVNKNIYEYDDGNPTDIPDIEPQTKAQAKKEKNEYRSSKARNWVQKYMKNMNYAIVDNEGGGDCFFAVVRDAFASINKQISVAQLREIVAMNTTEEQYNDYKSFYMSFKMMNDETEEEMKNITRQISDIKKQYNKLSNKKPEEIAKRKRLSQEAKRLKEEYKEHKETLYNTNNLIEHLSHMEYINSIDELRSFMRTRHYWADENAISIVEKKLNVKMIILSKAEYRAGSIKTVVQCGSVIDPEIEEKGVFKPKYYIPTEYLGYHYTSIVYKGMKIFKYEEIPYDLKLKLSLRCLEGLGGIYKFIPKFAYFYDTIKNIPQRSKSELFYKDIEETEETEKDDVGETVEDVDGIDAIAKADVELTQKVKTDAIDGTNQIMKDLYDDTSVLQFYERSANKYPGEGFGEKFNTENKTLLKQFNELNNIKDWRKILSNDYIFDIPIVIDDLQWKSVTHYYHASKYKKSNPELYNKFSLNSGTELANDIKLAKSVGRLDKKSLRTEYVDETTEIDSDFYPERCKQEKYTALQAKFTQIPQAKQVLLLTKPALLYEYRQGRVKQQANQLMKVRNEL